MRKPIYLTMLCLLLAACLASCRASADQRTGEAEGYGGKLKVSVTMNGEDITSVKVIEHHETEGVGTRAIDALPAAIAEADGIDVDGVSGATVTSNAIKEAVSQAVGMSGIIQQVIPMNGANATEASSLNALKGVGMASTGRVGPGKDSEGQQVYSFNVVFASGEFEEDGTIRAIKVDQLEVVSPNLSGGSAFSGFPENAEGEEDFLSEVASWTTKGAQGDSYMLTSGSWREQMDAYEQMMVGKTVDEVKEWYADRGNGGNTSGNGGSVSGNGGSTSGNGGSASGNGGSTSGNGSTPTTSETEATTAADAGTAQVAAPEGADAQTDAPSTQTDAASTQTDAESSATMSLQSEYGDILLAIERAWEDAQRNPASGGAMVDTNTVTDTTEGGNNVG